MKFGQPTIPRQSIDQRKRQNKCVEVNCNDGARCALCETEDKIQCSKRAQKQIFLTKRSADTDWVDVFHNHLDYWDKVYKVWETTISLMGDELGSYHQTLDRGFRSPATGGLGFLAIGNAIQHMRQLIPGYDLDTAHGYRAYRCNNDSGTQSYHVCIVST
jgi:hypothetical protein